MNALVPAACLLFMFGLSAYADRHVAPGQARLPMQWSLSGKVNWTASRRVALLMLPVMITLVMLLVLALVPPQTAEAQTALVTLSIIGPAVQVLHLALIMRTFGRGK